MGNLTARTVPLNNKPKKPEGERLTPESSRAQVPPWRTMCTSILNLLTPDSGRDIDLVKGVEGAVLVAWRGTWKGKRFFCKFKVIVVSWRNCDLILFFKTNMNFCFGRNFDWAPSS